MIFHHRMRNSFIRISGSTKLIVEVSGLFRPLSEISRYLCYFNPKVSVSNLKYIPFI